MIHLANASSPASERRGLGFGTLSFLLAGLLAAMHVGAQGNGTVSVDAQVRVSYSGLVLNRATNTFDTVATISNIGTTPVLAPMSLVVTSISVGTVQLSNATGTTASGLPYVSVALASGSLNAGAMVTPIVLKFADPTRVGFTFKQSVFGVLASSNHPPTANAGADQTVDVGAAVALDGTRSTDVDGDRLTYRWSFASIPTGSHATLANATSVDPGFVADVAGTYTVRLVANDGHADSAPANVVISTTNSRPVANAGRDQLVASGSVVRLDGTHSTDVDGDALTYHWTLASRPAGSAAALDAATVVAPSFHADKPGAYQAQLVVNDGHVDSAVSTVTLSTQNVAPVADAGPDQAVAVLAHVQLDGSRSSAANGGPVTYRWAFVTVPGGSSAALAGATTVNPTFSVDRAGIYAAQLIVNDGHGDSAPKIVVISTGNVRPVADAGQAQNAHVGDAVVLDGSASRDANGDALSFSWALLFKPANSSATLASADLVRPTLTCDVPGTFVAQLIVSDDALDSAPATSTVTVTVAPPNHDPQITSTAVTTGTVGVAYRYQVVATDQDGDPLTYGLSVFPAAMAISSTGLVTWTPGSSGTFAVTVRVTDGRGGSKTQSFNIVVASNGLPPDPSTVAPTLDPTGANSFFASTGFLYSGPNPIQTGVAPGTIDLKRASVLRGKVADSTGAALTGVNVSIVGHPEFGQTLSRLDGMFDLAANGGGRLTVRYAKTGFLPAQRQVQTNWQEFTVLPDVVLLPRDARVTTINFGGGLPSMQVARGSVQTDSDGSRQATVLFPAGTTAALVQPNGSMLPANTLNVRFTEYTVGANGPKAMPGDLPPTSTYTYAVELGADESVAKVNGRDVVFNQPIVYYVENFMKVPVGQIVPVGFYDPAQSTWIGAPNGRVIKILSITGGMANLDIDGDGVADTVAALTALGITNAERQQLAALYTAGTSLWRTPMDHFSTFDQNWSFVCIPTDCGPPDETPEPTPPCDQCMGKGSIVGNELQTLGEDIDIIGTPFTLHYESDRVPGRTAEQGQLLSLASHGVPNGVKAIQVEILVAGQKLTQTIPTSTGTTSFAWDGNDVYGRPLNGTFPVTIRVGYTYDIIATAGIVVPSSWARFTGIPLSVNAWRTQITLFQEHTAQIRRRDERGLGLGGWSLNVLHSYDASGHVLNFGDGTRREVDQLTSNVVKTVAGDGSATFGGDGVPAINSGISGPAGVAVGPDGSVYFVDGGSHRVIRVDPTGIQTTVAGTGARGFSGDGAQAKQAQLANPTSVALGLDGSVYISDRSNFRVRRVAPNGIISTFAGTGSQGVPTEGSLANATLIFPRNVAVGPDGRVFISDAKRIWVVDQNGVINAYAGSDALFGGDGGPALQAGLASPSGMAFASEGTLFFVDANQIRKVTPQGIISTVAGPGPGNGSFSGDGGPALSAGLDAPRDVAVTRDGSIYIAATNRVRRVGTDGVISTFAGNGAAAPFVDGGPGPQTTIATANGLAAGADQGIYVADAGHHRIRRIASALPGVSVSDILVPSEDGAEVYVFTGEGRHVRTVDGVTGATLLQFTYDAAGYPIAITDGDGNVTTIVRSGASPTAIVASGGQRTALATSADGWLTKVTNPASESRLMQYSASGLLTTYTDARGNTSRFQYDVLGRLVSDQNPIGGTVSLTRAEQANGFTVTATSSLGTTASYSVETQSNGDLLRTSIEPGGAKTVTLRGANGTDQITDPTGRTMSLTYGPDPRWGMLAPVAAAVTVSTPSGHQTKAATSATVVLTNASDPFSISTQSRTTTINGQPFTTTYAAASRTFTLQTPMGRQRTMTIDARGRVIQQAITGLFAQNWTYDARGRLQSMTGGTGVGARTLTLAYNADNTVQSWIDPSGRTETFAHDAAGRLTMRSFTDGRIFRYSYDLDGNVAGIVPPGRPQHTFSTTPIGLTGLYAAPDAGGGPAQTRYTYNNEGRLLSVTLPDTEQLRFQLDSGGRMTALTTAAGTTTYGYDAITGLPSTTTSADGVALTHTYDGDLWAGTTWSGVMSGKVARTYDNDFRVTQVSVNNVPIAFTYDADGLVTRAGALTVTRNAQNGLTTGTAIGSATDATTYTGFGDASTYNAVAAGAGIFQTSFTYDPLGRIQSKTEKIGGVTTTYAYTYDAAGRLAQVTTNGAVSASYTYDGNGNRLSAPGLVGTPTYDAQDRLLQYGATAYAYNANGDLTTKSSGAAITQYAYDALGNLKHVALPNGTAIDYAVDGEGRRALKKVNGNIVREYLYEDDFTPIAELDASGNVLSRFVYATRKNVPDYMIKQGVAYRVFVDQLGSPRVVVDSSTGQIVQRMDFDAFGNVVTDTNPGFQPFGFAGGLYDRDTGLVRFGFRDYAPDVGRWTSKDPVRFEGGDTNLYAYVLNDPINNADQLGLQRRGLLSFTPDLDGQLQELPPDPGALDVSVHSDGKSFLKDGQKVTDIDVLVTLVLESEQWRDYAKANPKYRIIRLVACKSGGPNATLAKAFYDRMNQVLKSKKQNPVSVKAPKDSFDYTNGEWNVRGFKNGKGWQMIP